MLTIIIPIIAPLCFFSLRERLRKRRAKKKKEIEEIIDKYVPEEKKGLMRQKLTKVFDLISKTEEYIQRIVRRKVKVAEDHYEFKKSEKELIRKAKLEYDLFISEFKSALPQTEAQKLLDMKELKSAISILESFDAEYYDAEKRAHDVGTGVFYEKMSRKFMSIIDEKKLFELDFIPIQRMKYEAFSSIKNIKNEDIIIILNIMKDTNLISDLLEINPQFHLIVFSEEIKLDLSNPEKVLLSFVYDEDQLSLQKLMELTEWKEDYARTIIDKLLEEKIVSLQGENIIVENFGDAKSRAKWNSVINSEIDQERKKEDEKRKKQKQRAAQLKNKLEKVEKVRISEDITFKSVDEEVLKEIKFKKKPSVKDLPASQEKSNKSDTQEIKDKDDLISAMEALDEIVPSKVASSSGAKPIKEEIPELQDLVPEKILNYHENFSLINGGFSQFEKIKQYIDQELENVPEDLLIKMLEQLKELQLIHDSIKIGNFNFYLFNDISLTEDDIKFIEFAINKKPMIKKEFIKGLEWEEEKTLLTMKRLQEKGILRIEKKYIIVPGIIQIK